MTVQVSVFKAGSSSKRPVLKMYYLQTEQFTSHDLRKEVFEQDLTLLTHSEGGKK